MSAFWRMRAPVQRRFGYRLGPVLTKSFCAQPLFHTGGIVRNLLAPIFAGGATILCAGFDPVLFWDKVPALGATWYYAAPTMHSLIMAEVGRRGAVPEHRVRFIGNAAGPLLPALAQQLRETFGYAVIHFPLSVRMLCLLNRPCYCHVEGFVSVVRNASPLQLGCRPQLTTHRVPSQSTVACRHSTVVLPSYGMTECMPIASPPPNFNLSERIGTSGRACGPELSIRDASGTELPTGATGNICVRGPPVFHGYEDPEVCRVSATLCARARFPACPHLSRAWGMRTRWGSGTGMPHLQATCTDCE